jgi:capsule polysaccharide export protein KpsE/RkpR
MVGCGPDDSSLTKLSKEHDAAVENITTQKGELTTAQEELKTAQEKVQKERQDVIDAQKKEGELR